MEHMNATTFLGIVVILVVAMFLLAAIGWFVWWFIGIIIKIMIDEIRDRKERW